MNHQVEVMLQSSVFDRSRKLIIDPSYLEFDDKDFIHSEPSKFLKEEIAAIRYGIEPIRGYRFYIGRIYSIDIMNNNGKVIKLRLKSLYGVRKNKLYHKYRYILNQVFKYYFDDISQSFLEMHNSKKSFEILGIIFNQQGLQFASKKDFINWEDLDISIYTTYFALFSKSNPTNYKAFRYLKDWNSIILYSVVEQIIKSYSGVKN